MWRSAQRRWRGLPIWGWVLGCVVVTAGIALGALWVTGNLGAKVESPHNELTETARRQIEEGDLVGAIADLETVVAENPQDSEAHFLLGQAYNQSGDLLKAADEFRTVLELDPGNAAAHHNLGVTYFQLQDPNTAISEFEAALEIDPDDADTRYQLGATYLVTALSSPTGADVDLMEAAVAEFEAALRLRENMPEALIGMSHVKMQEGDYGAAIEMLRNALTQLPSSPEAHFALAEAFARSGDAAQSCDAYQAFIELSPPEDWLTQAREEMRIIGCP
ncbi:MAG: tetratricopeptide repeat protein [Chloroflexi bacterium]|nr:tetratricopeptide repeat protein [Chloroflexota bacterium]